MPNTAGNSPDRGLLEPALKAQLDAVVARRGWWISLPPALEAAYRRRRVQQFVYLVLHGSPMLMLGFIVVIGLALLLYDEQLTGPDLSYQTAICIIISFIAACGGVMASFPRWQASFDKWLALMFALILFLKIIFMQFTVNASLAANDIYTLLIMTAIGVLTLALPVRNSALACIAAATGFIIGPLAFGSSPWLLEQLVYYITTCTILVAVAAFAEQWDRRLFLDMVQLQHESAVLALQNEQLDGRAGKDALTGLADRRAFDHALQREWDRARQEELSLALLLVDVDHFRPYNVHHGYEAGDACLARLGALLAQSLPRATDVAARYGGGQFALLLPGTGLAGASQMARELLAGVDGLGLPHGQSGTAAHVTVSMGVAVHMPGNHIPLPEFVWQAENALRQAKQEGRHRIVSPGLAV